MIIKLNKIENDLIPLVPTGIKNWIKIREIDSQTWEISAPEYEAEIMRTSVRRVVNDLDSINLDFYEFFVMDINDDNTYTVELRWIYLCPQTITPAQGRIMLSRLGKLEDIENTIEHMDKEAQIFWEYALSWDRLNPIVIQLANQFEFDIDNLFIEASKIE